MKRPYPEAITFLSLLTLNILMVFIYNSHNDLYMYVFKRILPGIIYSGGVSLITTLFIKYVYKYLHINLAPLFISIAGLILLVESFLLLNFYTLLMPSCFMAMFESNSRESSEFLLAYLNWQSLLLFLVFISIGTCLFIYQKKIQQIPFPQWCQSTKFVYTFSIVILLAYAGQNFYVNVIHHWLSFATLSGTERLIYSYIRAQGSRNEYKRYAQLFHDNIPEVTSTKDSIPYVVIILGESLSKQHVSAYGYPLPNSPKLNKRLQLGEALRYDSVITPRGVTIGALRRVMTFFNDQPQTEWYQYHTLPAVMKAAGYQSLWLSNQDGFNNSYDNSTIGIANTSSVVDFTHKTLNPEHHGYFDTDLLPLLDKYMAVNQAKRFICLHQMGSHAYYSYRYPPAFNKFTAKDIKRDLSEDKRQILAEYDNSVLYNDFVNDSIIQRFEDKEAVVFIFPDHGEELYDTRNMYGHAEINPSPPMIEIPFIVWTSKLFKEKRPELWARMQSSKQKHFNTTNLIHTIMDVCGIETKDYQVKKSLFYQP